MTTLMNIIFILDLLGCIVLVILHWMATEKNKRLASSLETLERRYSGAIRGEAAAHQNADEARRDAAAARRDANAAKRELEKWKDNWKSDLEKRLQGLQSRLKYNLVQVKDSPGNIVDQEIFRLVNQIEGEEICANGGTATPDGMLQTASSLFARLTLLPPTATNFTVRFKYKKDWTQPERWWIDDDGHLVLDIYEDGTNHDNDEFTVGKLMKLFGGEMNYEGQQVFNETTVFVNMTNNRHVRPLDVHFPINWKNRLVVIPCA